jgi:hypothetical protein
MSPNDDGRETFRWGPHLWDVTKALELYGDHSTRPILITPLAQIIAVGLVRVEMSHVPDVDLADPIMLVRMTIPGKANKALLPIDGWHRVVKGLGENMTHLDGIVLTDEESESVKISTAVPGGSGGAGGG